MGENVLTQLKALQQEINEFIVSSMCIDWFQKPREERTYLLPIIEEHKKEIEEYQNKVWALDDVFGKLDKNIKHKYEEQYKEFFFNINKCMVSENLYLEHMENMIKKKWNKKKSSKENGSQ